MPDSAPSSSRFSRFFRSLFVTQDTLTPEDTERGERMMLREGVMGMTMWTLQSGVFLVGFALALGASNYEIGLLTTIIFASQFLQLAGLVLVRMVRKRRAVTVLTAAASRLMWVPILLTPLLFREGGLTFVLLMLTLSYAIGAMAGPSWNSLFRDIIPEEKRAGLLSKRLAFGTGIGLLLTLAGGWFIDWWQTAVPGAPLLAYSLVFGLGLSFGLAGLVALARLPDPTLHAVDNESILGLLALPVKDANYRRLLIFMAIWSFAVNMAAPFFVVYMLDRMKLPLLAVTALTILSQLSNILFLGIWARLSDRLGNKAVLGASGLIFLLTILTWPFTTMPERYALTIPLLIGIHIFAGCAIAGVAVSSGNISLKLSPHGSAHAYMTAFSLAAAVTGCVAPLVGGILADFFAQREFSLALNWSEPGAAVSVFALNVKALDFVFILAFLFGLVSLQRLAHVEEGKAVGEGQVLDELLQELSTPLRGLASVAGMRRLLFFPLAAISARVNGDTPAPPDADAAGAPAEPPVHEPE